MIKTYTGAKEYLESFIPRPDTTTIYRLDRIRDFCKLLGDPQEKFPIIHVGGTSGKGSTATFAATILRELGLKTGLHTSPHLQSLTERFQINGHSISQSSFVGLLNQTMPLIKKCQSQTHNIPPTYYEILVGMCFKYFADEHVDAAVIEVGLGGRLDGTNIIPPSTVILTNISLDHTNILGKSVGKIAKEKMGIIKPGAPAVISGFSQPSLRKMIVKKCTYLHVPLLLLDRDFKELNLPVMLLGVFQRQNFSLAAQGGKQFVHYYFPGKKSHLASAIRTAGQTAFIPGRMEIVSQNPLVILDGAHNSAKMRALVTSVKDLYPETKWIAVVAFKMGKTYKTILKSLNQITARYVFTKFTLTTDSGAYQAENPREFTRLTHKSSEIETSAKKAVLRAVKLSRRLNLPILITGSLYLVGEVRSYLKKHTFLG